MWRAVKGAGLGVCLAAALGGAACDQGQRSPQPVSTSGTVGGTFGASGSGGSGIFIEPPVITGGGSLSCPGQLPWVPVTRASVVDIDGTFEALFGAGTTLASALSVDEDGFERDLSYVFVRALRRVASERAQELVDDSDSFQVCGAEVPGPTCIEIFLREWGEKLYRRPLTSQQLEAYVAQFQSATRGLSSAEAARNALVSLVLSPYFALRIELGDDKTGELTPNEVAARLSHFAARRAPDAPLRESARSGALRDPAELLAQLHRLWSLPEGKGARALQHMAWLGLGSRSQPTMLEPELRAQMFEQTEAFIDEVFTNQGATLRALLGSLRQPLTPALAAQYGIPAPAGAGLQLVDLDPQRFAGMLSQGLFLAQYPRPTLRGSQILQNLLCTEISHQPPGVDTTLADGRTARDRISSQVANQPTCLGCHDWIDPYGFALDAFDEQARLTGFATNAVLKFPDNTSVSVTTPAELANAITNSQAGRACVARHYLEYVLDRPLILSDSDNPIQGGGPPPIPARPEYPDQAWLTCLLQSLNSQDFNLAAAAEQLVSSPLFTSRATIVRRVVAFDTSVDPVEHARQEASQLRDVFPEPADEATIRRYQEALWQLQQEDAMPRVPGAGGEGGSGGDAAGGASNANDSGGAGGAGGAP